MYLPRYLQRYLVFLLLIIGQAMYIHKIETLKYVFLKKGSHDFFLLLALSCPLTNEKKLLKSFFWQLFCLQATAVDSCEVPTYVLDAELTSLARLPMKLHNL